ncbi:MFS transporter [Paenibacillus larvae]|uniref:MFS transporter n=1 Tax=Paenibacillus larvae subsp. pulvifaciens TaxID=1477 RepID=A0A1U9YUW3_9BACL|nr:MFS transporter [Paenibacillus larvae]AQZ49233.1 MFS transporter [Paenibacillus larvae subsp. pulvifaciens]ARF70646.1 MFS transporter [Paenibacillus larvae subsp. pulvifaciens]MBH0342230.1 major facilitator transporter [Paenibacillus larvae]MCY7518401.1 MFS transporter [Paenibacillus larvae]MCY9501993.1 MFS transporter [Paenibacillus larvae]
MNFRVYILAIAAFVVGTVELIIGGTLDLVADDLGVSIQAAGQFITIFSVVFALSGPILLALTGKIERKTIYIGALSIFLIGNLFSAFSLNYAMLMFSRVMCAASGSLIIALSVTLASSVVKPHFRARAIGLIFMGISGSLVLGVPLGLLLGNAYGWRAPFVFISALTFISIIAISIFLTKVPPGAVLSLKKQIATLKEKKIVSAQLTSFLFLTGHLTLYAYLTPFLKDIMHVEAKWISLFYFIFGIAAVIGGGFGGWLADKWGSKKSIISIIIVFACAMFLLPIMTFSFPLFIVMMAIWSMLSWAISPVQQNYLIEIAPESAAIQQSLNNSALHLGIAFGSTVGGAVIKTSSVIYNAWIGAGFIILALLCAVFSITRKQFFTAEKKESIA